MSNLPLTGRHFLQIPGPTNVPERVLHAIARATIDHRGPAFGKLGRDVLERVKLVFQTENPVIIYPSSGTGAWEAALVNTLSAGDTVLMFETGNFAFLWKEMAGRLGLTVDMVETDWRRGADPDIVEAKLAGDKRHAIKAVCVVHNETSTGVTARIADIRKAMDRANHPALLLVDTISSLGSVDYRHDEWGVDVTVSCSQKGLMLPPGLGFNAISDKALLASKSAGLPRAYWRWEAMLKSNETGFFPYTPASNLLAGLQVALDMMLDEGLDHIFARHARHGMATRAAAQAWGLEIQCAEPREYSPVLTAVRMPDGHSADAFRKVVLENCNMSLGNGLLKLADRVFRIGHLGDFNDPMLLGTLGAVELGLQLAGVPHRKGGVQAAIDCLAGT